MFESPLALIGLALVPVLIVLYLLKPKPKDYKIPTIMFLMDIEKKERFRSLFKKLIKDPALLFQILIISLIVFAIANMFFVTEAEFVSGNIILIIDSSASMQASDVSPDRFSAAVAEAREIIKKSGSNRITIITSGDTWSVKIKEGTADDALKTLEQVKVSNRATNIAYTMLSARDVTPALNGSERKVIYVLSDFSGTNVIESVMESKSRLESDGFSVVLKNIGISGKNTGVINVESYRASESKCLIKLDIANYNTEDAEADVFIDEHKANENKIKISSGVKESFSKEVGCRDGQEIKIKINAYGAGNDLPADDSVLVTAAKFKKVLFIDNDNELKSILSAIPDLKLTEGKETDSFSGFDAVVTNRIFDKNKIVDYVKGGGSFILAAPDTFYKWEYDDVKEILPVALEMDVSGSKAKITAMNTKIISGEGSGEFRKIDFSRYFLEVKQYYSAKNNNATVLAQAQDNTVLIAEKKGVFFVGFNSEWTNIKDIPTDVSYVTLWYGIIKSLKHNEEINCLCSERESDIMPGNVSSYEEGMQNSNFEMIKAQNKSYIFQYLLILGAILMAGEMYYLKIRGNI